MLRANDLTAPHLAFLGTFPYLPLLQASHALPRSGLEHSFKGEVVPAFTPKIRTPPVSYLGDSRGYAREADLSMDVLSAGVVLTALPALEGAGENAARQGQIMAFPADRAGSEGSTSVLGGGHWLQVIRFDTVPHATKVIDLKAIRDRSAEFFIYDTVDTYRHARTARLEVAIPVRRPRSCPYPATRLGEDHSGLPAKWVQRGSMRLYAPIMLLTHSPSQVPGATVTEFNVDTFTRDRHQLSVLPHGRNQGGPK